MDVFSRSDLLEESEVALTSITVSLWPASFFAASLMLPSALSWALSLLSKSRLVPSVLSWAPSLLATLLSFPSTPSAAEEMGPSDRVVPASR
jgi:hypothetical protein